MNIFYRTLKVFLYFVKSEFYQKWKKCEKEAIYIEMLKSKSKKEK